MNDANTQPVHSATDSVDLEPAAQIKRLQEKDAREKALHQGQGGQVPQPL